jgi:hypothetical protein
MVVGDYEFIDVSSEIVRHADWLEHSSGLIAALGDERETIQTQLDGIEDLIKFADGNKQDQVVLERRLKAVNSKLTEMLAQERVVKTKLSRLQKYQNAIDTVKSETTADLLNQSLPQLPQADTEAKVATASSEPVTEVQPSTPTLIDQTTTASRQSHVLNISQVTGLPIATILAITLYEILPAEFAGSKRAVMKIFGLAQHVGILATFGIERAFDAGKTWGADKEGVNTYLKYMGTVGKMNFYCRNNTKLPWFVHEVLLDQEVQAFQEAFREATNK